MFKKEIVNLLSKHVRMKKQEIEDSLESPPNSEFGDYAFPCFILAKRLNKNPSKVAKDLSKRLEARKEISKIEVKGAYLNFFINKDLMAKKIIEINEDYGKRKLSKKEKKKIMVEFPSPNTNKPLHLGHLRNMAIGESVSRILEFSGNEVIRANLNNDRGVHICKSMVAYKKWGKSDTPEKAKEKSDHFVGDYYVLFNEKLKQNIRLKEEVQECLKKWEQGDKETVELWKKMNKWALEGFKETYRTFKIRFDKEYFESKIFKKGKEIIKEGVEKRIFKKRLDGSVVIELGKKEKDDLGEKVLLRADGTSLYIIQDLYLAKLKAEEYGLDSSIYVVGNEQDYHFKVLFSILKELNFNFSDNLHHLSYGLVEVPGGRLKSSEGRIVKADDLIKETQDLAIEELKKRYKLSERQLEKRSLEIAVSAIKYNLLKIDVARNMFFDPTEAISFEGDTGSYLQYSYARASSIVRKSKKTNKKMKSLESQEIELIKKISEFPEKVKRASKNLDPSIIANYSFQLAQTFTEFYHNCPVIKSKNETFRLSLTKAFRITMKNALYLLGIDAIEKM